MLLDTPTLDEILNGRITLQFRRWTRPTVKTGGTLTTAIGVLAIEAVDVVERGAITEEQARAAGAPSLSHLLDALDARATGTIHRVRLSFAGPDPRIALRETLPDQREIDEVLRRLDGHDARSPRGPWTLATLRAIEEEPGVGAAHLARAAAVELKRFKTDVRKLKALGLTESLEIGYRLSPRGGAVLEARRAGSEDG